AAVMPRLRASADRAKAALERFGAHLRDVVIPAAEGDGLLGPELFEAKLRHTLRSDLTVAQVLERAEREYGAVRTEMVRLARDLWPAWVPDRDVPSAASAGDELAAENLTVRTVLDAIAAEHPRPEDMLDE